MTQSIVADQSILRQILVRSAQPAKPGLTRLAVFDLDSTLFDVSPRLQKVLDHFAESDEHKRRFPQLIPFFKNAKAQRTDWGVRQALERSGLGQADSDFQDAIREFWRQTFFSNEYLQHDVPYEGAVEFVQRLWQQGVEIVYLTGRDQHRMGHGSPEVLKKWNFPLDPIKARLVLKPNRSMDDAEFKKDWFLNLPKQTYEVIWFFENEPVNINLIRDQVPEIDIIFFDSTHSRKESAPADLPKVKHFLIDSYSLDEAKK